MLKLCDIETKKIRVTDEGDPEQLHETTFRQDSTFRLGIRMLSIKPKPIRERISDDINLREEDI